MRVSIDWDLCVGSGLCVNAAPRAFALVPHGREQRVVLAGVPTEPRAIEAAARACPTLAIRLVDDEGRVRYPPPEAVALDTPAA